MREVTIKFDVPDDDVPDSDIEYVIRKELFYLGIQTDIEFKFEEVGDYEKSHCHIRV
jgi:hypothetical protein